MRKQNPNLSRIKNTSALFLQIVNRLWSINPLEMSRFSLTQDRLPNIATCKQLACSPLMRSHPNEIQFLISTILALNSIKDAEAAILWDEFFIPNSIPRTRRDSYSHSGYYRLRDHGITSFFFILDSTNVLPALADWQ